MSRAMKDSGIPWIGEIPEGWEIVQLKFLLEGMQDGTHGTFQRVPSSYLLLSAKNVFDDGIRISNNESTISQEDYTLITSNGYPRINDIAICCVGTIGRCCIYRESSPIAFQRSVTFLRVKDSVDVLYVLYALRSSVSQIQFNMYAKASAQSGIYMKDLSALKVIFPPVAEQEAIAEFLDRKCGEVDEMVSLQEQVIEELKAYKQSVITEAVTKGLNPSAPMKPSNIDWIGQIPSHWGEERFKSKFKTAKGLSFTKADLVHSGNPVISYGQIHAKYNTGTAIDLNMVRYVPDSIIENGCNSKVKMGDFIFADTSEDIDGCGNCVYIDRNTELFAGYHTVIASSFQNADNKYYAYLFLTDCWRSQIRMRVSGIKVFSISQSILNQTSLIVPPHAEQREIADYLDRKCADIDALIALKQQKIEELKQYKKSLIYEYVTGKKAVPCGANANFTNL